MNHCALGRIGTALILFLAVGAATLFAPSLAAAQGGEPGDWRYGVIESTDDPAAATRLGASWTRVRFQWAEVQAEGPNAWEPPIDDEALQTELDDGRMVVGLLIGIPDWARGRDKLPRGLYLDPDDPGNTWATFVREAVSRYEGQIDHWVIWNEPDIDDPTALGHTWDGTPEDFAQLLRVAYLVAKETNPDAVVHLGAFTYFWDPGYFGRFLDILLADPAAADHDYYFDVATAHLYFQPERVYDVINAFGDDMADRGLHKPIWLVETNAPPADDSYWLVPNWTLHVTLYEQAAFIPQAMASALAAGAERIAVFKLKDVPGDREANPEPFGLLRPDNSRRPAFDTYRVAIDVLANAGDVVRERWDEVGQFRVDQGDQTTTVLFTRLPEEQTAVVPATAETAELIDMWGKRHTVTARGGNFFIDLQPALCSQTIGDYCMIGGTVLYLVQQAGEVVLPGDLPLDERATAEAGSMAPAITTAPTATATPAPQEQPTQPPATAPLATPPATPTTMTVVALPTVTAAPPGPTPMNVAPPAAGSGRNSGFIFLGLGLVGAVVLGAWLWGSRRQP